MNLFSILKKSIFQIDEYKNLIKISNVKFYLYILLLSLLFSLYIYLNLYSQFGNFNKKVEDFIENKIPEFKIENGNLSVDENIEYTFFDNSLKLIVNTTDNLSISDFPSYNDIILVTRDEFLAKSFNNTETISIKELSSKLNIYSKRDLIDNKLIKLILNILNYLIVSICLIMGHITLILKLFLLSMIVKISELYSKVNLKFSEILKLTAFSYTMPLLFLIVLNSIGIYVHIVIQLIMFYAISCLGIRSIEKEKVGKES